MTYSGHITPVPMTQMIADYDTLELKTFEYTEHNLQDMEDNIDPENNFFCNINADCGYYTAEQYNKTIKADQKLSMIHFNSRSLYANFQNIQEYLRQFSQPFNIIAISETWINPERGVDFEIEGYELYYRNRENKTGGGVAVCGQKP